MISASNVAIVRRVVRRINARLPPGRFLVAKRRGGALVYYCLASGYPTTAHYKPEDAPVDLVNLAGRVGVTLTAHELETLEGGVAA